MARSSQNMARKNTSSRRSDSGKRTLVYAGAAAAVAVMGGAAYYFLRSGRTMSGASSLDKIPSDPMEDRFGNRGDDNMVEPLSFREDQINMRDRMNPYNGLY
jgi:hypothetical protein